MRISWKKGLKVDAKEWKGRDYFWVYVVATKVVWNSFWDNIIQRKKQATYIHRERKWVREREFVYPFYVVPITPEAGKVL